MQKRQNKKLEKSVYKQSGIKRDRTKAWTVFFVGLLFLIFIILVISDESFCDKNPEKCVIESQMVINSEWINNCCEKIDVTVGGNKIKYHANLICFEAESKAFSQVNTINVNKCEATPKFITQTIIRKKTPEELDPLNCIGKPREDKNCLCEEWERIGTISGYLTCERSNGTASGGRDFSKLSEAEFNELTDSYKNDCDVKLSVSTITEKLCSKAIPRSD